MSDFLDTASDEPLDIFLYSAEGSNSSERVEWALNYKAIPYTQIEVTNEELTGRYLHINPFGYVPALSIDGYLIAESMAIVECLEELYPDPSLLPKSAFERASVREVCEYINSTIHAPQNRSVLKTLRPDISEEEKRQLRADWICQGLAKLRAKLCLDSRFAIGEEFTLADIFVASIYKKALQHGAAPIGFYDKHLNWLQLQERVSFAEPNKRLK